MFSFHTLKTKFSRLPQSDKRAIAILSLFFVLVLLALLTKSSFNYLNTGIKAFNEGRSLIQLIYSNTDKLRLIGVAKPVAGSDQSLLAVSSSTAGEIKIQFKRFQPESDQVLKLWIENVSFNNLLIWLHRIDHMNGISVDEISIEQRKEEGFVDARLTLVRD